VDHSIAASALPTCQTNHFPLFIALIFFVFSR
jgi:hypothetical protein